MQEPRVNRESLLFWMPVSIAVALALIWIGLDLSSVGVDTLQPASRMSLAGAMGFGFLLIWAAYAYAISITTPHDAKLKAQLWAGLILPIVVLALINGAWAVWAMLLALAWLALLLRLAWVFAPREPLAALMLLPLMGSALTAVLFSLTLLMLPR
ncbi:MAG: hypothetical protein ACP5DC_00990 [Halothiobacillaceae bacterium]